MLFQELTQKLKQTSETNYDIMKSPELEKILYAKPGTKFSLCETKLPTLPPSCLCWGTTQGVKARATIIFVTNQPKWLNMGFLKPNSVVSEKRLRQNFKSHESILRSNKSKSPKSADLGPHLLQEHNRLRSKIRSKLEVKAQNLCSPIICRK